MKVHIHFPFQDGPWGGGNQFLKALKVYFAQAGQYVESPREADVVLFNSHHDLAPLLDLSREIQAVLVHRVDGPIFRVRGKGVLVDRLIFRANRLLSDGTVFQSQWSRENNLGLGMKPSLDTVITNAPDGSLFHARGRADFAGSGRIRIIAASWSPNWGKGFETYQWLDRNLDFSRYAMTFVGNSPVEFKNIQRLEPLPSAELAGQFRDHDVFLTASRNDPCSNTLIEAMHCGLPALGLNSGGHPEIIGSRGFVFDLPEQVPALLEQVARNRESLLAGPGLPDMEEIGARYEEFFATVCSQGKTRPRPGSRWTATMAEFRFRLLGHGAQRRTLLGRIMGAVADRVWS